MSSTASPEPQKTTPMTPSAALQTTPLSPASPSPSAQKKDSADLDALDNHIEEYGRYGRRGSRLESQEKGTAGSPAVKAKRSASVEKGLKRHVQFGDGHDSQAPSTNASTVTPIPPQSVDEKKVEPIVADKKNKQKMVKTGEREWHRGLFDCFSGDGNDCAMTTFLPCVAFGEIQYRIEHPQDPELANYDDCNAQCAGCCLLGYCLTPIISWVWAGAQRNEVRHQHHINGSGLEDCATCAFCGPCGLCQELDHMKHEGDVLIAKKKELGEAAGNYYQQAPMAYTARGANA